VDATSPPAQTPAASSNPVLPAPTASSDSVSDAGPAYAFQTPQPAPELGREARAKRLANLSPGECRRRIAQGKLPFLYDRPRFGITTAVRFRGSIGLVTFVTPPQKSPFGALDCRLGLALAELVPVLTQHEVTEMRIENFYRPPSRRTQRRRISQHTRGLAADVTGFTLRDGRTLVVERDWQGQIGTPSCGPDSHLREASDSAIRLRNLVCAMAATQVFDTLLTPNHDPAHRDHLHCDLRQSARSTILR
jgi:hypothetical protein